METKDNKIIKKYGIAVLSIFLTALYPCLYMYFNNILETHLVRIIMPLGVFCFIGILFFALVQRLYHNPDKSALVSCIFLFMFTNYMIIYKLFESKIDGFKYIHMTIIFAVILFAVMYVTKKVNMDNTPSQVISFVLAGLIAFNGLSCIPDVLNSKKEVEAFEVTQHGDISAYSGNVYYFIIDEYGGKENLKYFFDFENEEFLSGLRDKGFEVSDSSYNYEGLMTMDILPNILNLDYVIDNGNVQASNLKYFKEPVLYRFFKDMGYKVNLINHQNFLDPTGTNVLFESEKKNLKCAAKDMDKYLIDNSAINAIYQTVGINYKDFADYTGYRQEVEEAFDVMENSWEYAKDDPTLTVTYLMCPHRPFVFDENGESLRSDQAYDWEDKSLYVNQMKYINKRLSKVMDSIIANDPSAVIVMQADHGARYSYFTLKDYEKNEFNSKTESEKMQNVLNCVYVPDREIDIEGDSCINTWRKVLNELYNTDYEMIYAKKKYCYKWKYTTSLQ